MGWPFCHPKTQPLKVISGEILKFWVLLTPCKKYVYIYIYILYIYIIPVTHFPDWFQPQTKHLTRKQTLQHRHLRPGNPTGETCGCNTHLETHGCFEKKKKIQRWKSHQVVCFGLKKPLVVSFSLGIFLRCFIFQKKNFTKKNRSRFCFQKASSCGFSCQISFSHLGRIRKDNEMCREWWPRRKKLHSYLIRSHFGRNLLFLSG